MAVFGRKFEFTFNSQNGSLIEIEILQKGYTGQVIKRSLGRAPILKRESNGCIYGTSLEIYAEAKVEGEYIELYTSSADEYKVRLYKNSTLVWIGYVTPELYSEPDIAPPYDVQIIATDGLGELRNYNFEGKGENAILTHINSILEKTQLSLDVECLSTLQGISVSEEFQESSIVDALNILVNFDHLSSKSCYDVLQLILSSLHATITQNGAAWLLMREVDIIDKITNDGLIVESNSITKTLPIAKFGSAKNSKWWPVGNLSSTVVPAKNQIKLKSESNYKLNVLGKDWAGSATFDTDAATYMLSPGALMSQKITFSKEISFRLLLTIKARCEGGSDEEPNIGVKVKIFGLRPTGKHDYWLIKPSASTNRKTVPYKWQADEEGSFNEALEPAQEGATIQDAQDIQVVIPIYYNGPRDYTYASDLELSLFNPNSTDNIIVYDIAIAKYEQVKGYETIVNIQNNAREEGDQVEVGIMSKTAQNYVDSKEFMYGVPITNNTIINSWSTFLFPEQDLTSILALDYATSVALPRVRMTGILNIPVGERLPMIFANNGQYYILEGYSYNLYDDELDVSLISIPNADVSIYNIVETPLIEGGNITTANSSSGGSGGSSGITLDENMSDTSTNGVQNKVIKAYVDGLFNKLNTWKEALTAKFYLGADGNVYCDTNLIVNGDTASSGGGQDIPSGGLDYNDLQKYLDDNGYIDETAINSKMGSLARAVQETYFSKENASAAFTAISATIDKKADKDSLDTLAYTEVKDIAGFYLMTTGGGGVGWASADALLGNLGLRGIDTTLANMQTDINKRALQSDLLILEQEVADIKSSGSHSDLSQYIKIENGKVRVVTDLIVKGDTASGGTPDPSTNQGIDEEGLREYLTTNEYINSSNYQYYGLYSKPSTGIPISDLSLYIRAVLQTAEEDHDLIEDFNGDIANLYNIKANKADLGNLAYMNSIDVSDIQDLSDYFLPLSGGTISGDSADLLVINRKSDTSSAYITFRGNDTLRGRIGFNSSLQPVLQDVSIDSANHIILHDGNIGNYTPRRQGRQATLDLNTASNGFYEAGYTGQNLSNSPSATNALFMDFRDANGYAKAQFYATSFNDLYFRARHGASATIDVDWKTIAFTDSDITGNAATATKLATARTIWGQSFDGTGNVSGGICFNKGNAAIRVPLEDGGEDKIFLQVNPEGHLLMGQQLAKSGKDTLFYGNNIKFCYGTAGSSSATAMFINSSGNVTIGGSDLAKTSFKLYVDGQAVLNGTSTDLYWNVDNGTYKLGFGIGSSGVNRGIYDYTNSSWLLLRTDNLNISFPNGNVGIGTTSPQYKLDVNGTVAFGTTGGCDVWLKRTTGYNYINAAHSLAFTVNNDSTNIAAIFGSDKKATFYGAVTMSSTLGVAGGITTTLLKSNGGLDIVANNSGAGSKLFLTTNVFRPWGVDAGLIDLGASEIRWRGLYCGTGNFSGEVTIDNNLIVSGDTSSGSDIRFKDIVEHKTLSIADIANAPLFTFKWNDREDDKIHLGTSAQYWESIAPELVSGEDFKHLNYASLGVAMGIALAKKNINHEERIKMLEDEVKILNQEINRLRNGKVC